MPRISHSATFSPDDTLDRMLDDLTCPACGHQDLGNARNWMGKNKIRIFCEGCGAFITVSVSDEQAAAIHRWAMTAPANHGG